jgi:hypothetical protein
MVSEAICCCTESPGHAFSVRDFQRLLLKLNSKIKLFLIDLACTEQYKQYIYENMNYIL